MAWLASGGALRTVPQPSAASMTCHWSLSGDQPQLALAADASAVLWTLHEGGASPFDYVLTSRIGGPEERIDRLAHTETGIGLWPTLSTTSSTSTSSRAWREVRAGARSRAAGSAS